MPSSLFTPFSVKSLKLKNRFVMSPMTRNFSPGGVPTADVGAYYARRAAHDVGLIITEGTAVDRPAAVDTTTIPRFHGDKALDGWKDVVKAVHAKGGKIAPQLWHIGNQQGQEAWTPPSPFEGPSGLKDAGTKAGVAMSEKDITDVIAAFASAAKTAKDIGFDCVAIHGAHGYLPDQFYWADTNTRADKWGGKTLAERGRFTVELVKAVRQAVGTEFTIFLRISQWKIQAYHHQMAKTAQELESWVQPLADAGVDIFDCSQRRFWEPEFEGSDLNFAGWVKKVTGKATMTVGSIGLSTDLMSSFAEGGADIRSIDDLQRRFDRGDFDLIAIGRILLSDPEWVEKIRDQRTSELKRFNPADMAALT